MEAGHESTWEVVSCHLVYECVRARSCARSCCRVEFEAISGEPFFLCSLLAGEAFPFPLRIKCTECTKCIKCSKCTKCIKSIKCIKRCSPTHPSNLLYNSSWLYRHLIQAVVRSTTCVPAFFFIRTLSLPPHSKLSPSLPFTTHPTICIIQKP